MLSILAGVAVVRAIRKTTGLDPRIKWPNDVMIDGKKVCGILVESVVQGQNPAYAILGIGINVNLDAQSLEEIDGAATAISAAAGHDIPRENILGQLLLDIDSLYLRATQDASPLAEWKTLLETLGQRVRAYWGQDSYFGVAEDIDELGNLQLRLDDGRLVTLTAGDVTFHDSGGTSTRDLAVVRRRTKFAAGFDDGGSGDPSPITAWGVFHGIRAAVAHRLGRPDLIGTVVSVQGLGHVGEYLCQFLHEAGAKLVVADIDAERVTRVAARFDAKPVAPEAIYTETVDVFAPSAMGAILNDETIPVLNASVVAGSANNQLAKDRHGGMLAERNILYAPDYVINAGGIININ